jgi:membrane protein CcdC involved in cytochrome C biogenesis
MHVFPAFFQTLAPFMAVFMGIMMLFMRIRASGKPTNARKIIIPPLGMSTGFLMFLFPEFRIPLTWAAIAFLTGAIFLSIPLIKTSRFEVKGDQIYLKRSRAFILILVTLLVIRMALHSYIEQYHISIFQTGGLFFILAFGMLLPWRLAMLMRYKKLEKEIQQRKATQNPN